MLNNFVLLFMTILVNRDLNDRFYKKKNHVKQMNAFNKYIHLHI